jgi:excisionase family DNA binding protein
VNNAPTRDDADESVQEDDEWILPSEAAARFSIGRRTVYNWISEGVVPVRVIAQGRRRYYQVRRDALEALVQVRVEELRPVTDTTENDD